MAANTANTGSVLRYIPDYVKDNQASFKEALSGLASSARGGAAGSLLRSLLSGGKMTAKEREAAAKKAEILGITQDIQALPEYKAMMEVAGNEQYPIANRIEALEKFKRDVLAKAPEMFGTKYPGADVSETVNALFAPMTSSLKKEKQEVIEDSSFGNALRRGIPDMWNAMTNGIKSGYYDVTNQRDELMRHQAQVAEEEQQRLAESAYARDQAKRTAMGHNALDLMTGDTGSVIYNMTHMLTGMAPAIALTPALAAAGAPAAVAAGAGMLAGGAMMAGSNINDVKSRIYNDPNLTPEQKAEALDNNYSTYVPGATGLATGIMMPLGSVGKALGGVAKFAGVSPANRVVAAMANQAAPRSIPAFVGDTMANAATNGLMMGANAVSQNIVANNSVGRQWDENLTAGVPDAMITAGTLAPIFGGMHTLRRPSMPKAGKSGAENTSMPSEAEVAAADAKAAQSETSDNWSSYARNYNAMNGTGNSGDSVVSEPQRLLPYEQRMLGYNSEAIEPDAIYTPEQWSEMGRVLRQQAQPRLEAQQQLALPEGDGAINVPPENRGVYPAERNTRQQLREQFQQRYGTDLTDYKFTSPDTLEKTYSDGSKEVINIEKPSGNQMPEYDKISFRYSVFDRNGNKVGESLRSFNGTNALYKFYEDIRAAGIKDYKAPVSKNATVSQNSNVPVMESRKSVENWFAEKGIVGIARKAKRKNTYVAVDNNGREFGIALQKDPNNKKLYNLYLLDDPENPTQITQVMQGTGKAGNYGDVNGLLQKLRDAYEKENKNKPIVRQQNEENSPSESSEQPVIEEQSVAPEQTSGAPATNSDLTDLLNWQQSVKNANLNRNLGNLRRSEQDNLLNVLRNHREKRNNEEIPLANALYEMERRDNIVAEEPSNGTSDTPNSQSTNPVETNSGTPATASPAKSIETSSGTGKTNEITGSSRSEVQSERPAEISESNITDKGNTSESNGKSGGRNSEQSPESREGTNTGTGKPAGTPVRESGNTGNDTNGGESTGKIGDVSKLNDSSWDERIVFPNGERPKIVGDAPKSNTNPKYHIYFYTDQTWQNDDVDMYRPVWDGMFVAKKGSKPVMVNIAVDPVEHNGKAKYGIIAYDKSGKQMDDGVIGIFDSYEDAIHHVDKLAGGDGDIDGNIDKDLSAFRNYVFNEDEIGKDETDFYGGYVDNDNQDNVDLHIIKKPNGNFRFTAEVEGKKPKEIGPEFPTEEAAANTIRDFYRTDGTYYDYGMPSRPDIPVDRTTLELKIEETPETKKAEASNPESTPESTPELKNTSEEKETPVYQKQSDYPIRRKTSEPKSSEPTPEPTPENIPEEKAVPVSNESTGKSGDISKLDRNSWDSRAIGDRDPKVVDDEDFRFWSNTDHNKQIAFSGWSEEPIGTDSNGNEILCPHWYATYRRGRGKYAFFPLDDGNAFPMDVCLEPVEYKGQAKYALVAYDYENDTWAGDYLKLFDTFDDAVKFVNEKELDSIKSDSKAILKDAELLSRPHNWSDQTEFDTVIYDEHAHPHYGSIFLQETKDGEFRFTEMVPAAARSTAKPRKVGPYFASDDDARIRLKDIYDFQHGEDLQQYGTSTEKAPNSDETFTSNWYDGYRDISLNHLKTGKASKVKATGIDIDGNEHTLEIRKSTGSKFGIFRDKEKEPLKEFPDKDTAMAALSDAANLGKSKGGNDDLGTEQSANEAARLMAKKANASNEESDVAPNEDHFPKLINLMASMEEKLRTSKVVPSEFFQSGIMGKLYARFAEFVSRKNPTMSFRQDGKNLVCTFENGGPEYKVTVKNIETTPYVVAERQIYENTKTEGVGIKASALEYLRNHMSRSDDPDLYKALNADGIERYNSTNIFRNWDFQTLKPNEQMREFVISGDKRKAVVTERIRLANFPEHYLNKKGDSAFDTSGENFDPIDGKYFLNALIKEYAKNPIDPNKIPEGIEFLKKRFPILYSADSIYSKRLFGSDGTHATEITFMPTGGYTLFFADGNPICKVKASPIQTDPTSIASIIYGIAKAPDAPTNNEPINKQSPISETKQEPEQTNSSIDSDEVRYSKFNINKLQNGVEITGTQDPLFERIGVTSSLFNAINGLSDALIKAGAHLFKAVGDNKFGEGNQMHGFGVYVAFLKDTIDHYREYFRAKGSPEISPFGKDLDTYKRVTKDFLKQTGVSYDQLYYIKQFEKSDYVAYQNEVRANSSFAAGLLYHTIGKYRTGEAPESIYDIAYEFPTDIVTRRVIPRSFEELGDEQVLLRAYDAKTGTTKDYVGTVEGDHIEWNVRNTTTWSKPTNVKQVSSICIRDLIHSIQDTADNAVSKIKDGTIKNYKWTDPKTGEKFFVNPDRLTIHQEKSPVYSYSFILPDAEDTLVETKRGGWNDPNYQAEWDPELQSSHIKEAIRKICKDRGIRYDKFFYKNFMEDAFKRGETPAQATEYLYKNGLPGISYTGGRDGDCMVVFNPQAYLLHDMWARKTGAYKGNSTSISDIQEAIKPFEVRSGKSVKVVQHVSELPEELIKGQEDYIIEGVYDPRTGTQYIVADNIGSAERAKQVWLHEAGVHNGLRAIYSNQEINNIMNRLYQNEIFGNTENLRVFDNFCKERGYSSESINERNRAMEEFIATMAEQHQTGHWRDPASMNIWQKFVQYVKDMFQKVFKGSKTSPETIDDLLDNLGRHLFYGDRGLETREPVENIETTKMGGIVEENPIGDTGTYEIKETMDNALERQTHEQLAKQFDELIPRDETPTLENEEPINNSEVESIAAYFSRRLHATGEQYEADIKLAETGVKNRIAYANKIYEQFKDALNIGYNTWLHTQTKLAKNYLNHSAVLEEYINCLGNLKDRAIYDHPLIRALRDFGADVSAATRPYKEELAELRKQQFSIADRMGISVDEVVHDLGNGAIYLHMPERNDYLIKRWREIADEILSDDHLTNSKIDAAANYRQMAQSLEDHLDLIRDDNSGPLETGGWTNAEAKANYEALLQKGYTDEEIKAFSRALTEMSSRWRSDLFRKGVMGKDVAEEQPPFSQYVPVISGENWNKLMKNDITPFHPGSFKNIQGMTGHPDSAWEAMINYADRAGRNIGSIKLVDSLRAWYDWGKATKKETGLRIESYNNLVSGSTGGLEKYAETSEYLEAGGLVYNNPETGEKEIIMFDPNFVDKNTGYTGKQLNEALLPLRHKEENGLEKTLKTSTGIYGQLLTRGKPIFAIGNMMSDTMERMFALAGRDLIMEDGTHVHGSKFTLSYIGNWVRSGKMLFDALTGRADPNSDAAKYAEEFRQEGLHLDYTTDGLREEKGLFSELKDNKHVEGLMKKMRKESPEMYKLLEQTFGHDRGMAAKAIRCLDNWNDYWNTIPAFNQYVTLRMKGVSRESAKGAVLDFMNLKQEGHYTAFMRCLYPFVKPTAMGTAAAMRTLGFAYDPRGFFTVHNAKSYGFVIGSLIVASMLKDVITNGLGTDENGNNKIDNIPLTTLSRYVLLPSPAGDGEYLKIRTGFGIPQLVSTLVHGLDRVNRGLMTPQDLTATMMSTVVTNMAPGNFPAFNYKDDPFAYLAQTLAPTVFRPYVEVATNKPYYGGTLVYPQASDKLKSDTGGVRSSRMYNQVAKWIYKYFGLDMAPEQVENIANNLLIGPLGIIKSYMEANDPGRKNTAFYKDSHLNPYFATLGGNMLYDYARPASSTAFYTALDRSDALLKRSHINLSDHPAGLTGEKLSAAQRKIMRKAGLDEDTIHNIIVLREAQRSLQGKSKEINSMLRATILNGEEEEKLRQLFEDYAAEKEKVHQQALSRLR